MVDIDLFPWMAFFKICGFFFIEGGRVMVFNATINNISDISKWSVLMVEETGENHRPATIRDRHHCKTKLLHKTIWEIE
jgi:hypothetical protein